MGDKLEVLEIKKGAIEDFIDEYVEVNDSNPKFSSGPRKIEKNPIGNKNGYNLYTNEQGEKYELIIFHEICMIFLKNYNNSSDFIDNRVDCRVVWEDSLIVDGTVVGGFVNYNELGDEMEINGSVFRRFVCSPSKIRVYPNKIVFGEDLQFGINILFDLRYYMQNTKLRETECKISFNSNTY